MDMTYETFTKLVKDASYDRERTPWGGGKVVYECEGFAIIAQAVTGSDKTQLMVCWTNVAPEPPRPANSRRVFGSYWTTKATSTLLAPHPVRPQHVQTTCELLQNIITELVRLREGGWRFEEQRGEGLSLSGNYWCYGVIGNAAQPKTVKGFHYNRNWWPSSYGRSLRKLRRFHKQVRSLSDSPDAAKNTTVYQPLDSNIEKLDEVARILDARDRKRIPEMALSHQPEMTAMEIVEVTDQALSLLDSGQVQNSRQAVAKVTSSG
jgi:hypothetical protein